jgi:hypothetical protein
MSITVIYDNWGTTLSAAITASATSIPLSASFPTLPAGSVSYLTLADPTNTILEVIQITVGGGTPTAVRGVNGVNQAWPSGTTIELRDCAEAIAGMSSPGTIPYAFTSSPDALTFQQVMDARGVDIRHFGAVMNTTADQTAAFTAAIAALTLVGGGTIIIPPGYLLANIVIPGGSGGIRICGAGKANIQSGSTILNYIGPYNNALPVIKIGDGTALVEGCHIDSLCLYTPSGSGTAGILFYDGAYKCSADHVQIMGFATYGIEFTNANLHPNSFNNLHDITVQSSQPLGAGIVIMDPGDQTHGWTSAITISDFNINTQYYQLYGSGGSIAGSYSGYGIYLGGAQISFANSYMDSVSNPPTGFTFVSVTLDMATDYRSSNFNNVQAFLGQLNAAGTMLVLAAHTTGSITTGTAALAVSSAAGFVPGRQVQVAGAGTSGIPLIASVVSVSGLVVTLDTNASTTVSSVDTAYGDIAPIECAGTSSSNIATPGLVFAYGASQPKLGPSWLTCSMERLSGAGTSAPFNGSNLLLSTSYNTAFDVLQPTGTPIPVTSISQSGTTVTVTTTSAHGLQTGDGIQLIGANEAGINTLWALITYLTATTFSYTSATSITTGSATGTFVLQAFGLISFSRGDLRIGSLSMKASTGTSGRVLYTDNSDANLNFKTPDTTNGVFAVAWGSSITTGMGWGIGPSSGYHVKFTGNGVVQLIAAAAPSSSSGWGQFYYNTTDTQCHAMNGAGNDGAILTTARALTVHTAAAPTSTVSTTAVMMAAGGTITPVLSTRAMIMISGQMANSTAGDGATVDVRYGTGTAPSNGSAVTGTLVGIAQSSTSVSAGQKSGFCVCVPITGLTVGTAVWVDLSLMAVTGGTASITGVTVSVVEV